MRWYRFKRAAEWRWRFALLPTQVGDEMLWLEWYQQKGGGCSYYRRLVPGSMEHSYQVGP
jgi:hypothetical protein